MGYSGDRLGIWEFQAENGATELIHRQNKTDETVEDNSTVSRAFRQVYPNPARPIQRDQK